MYGVIRGHKHQLSLSVYHCKHVILSDTLCIESTSANYRLKIMCFYALIAIHFAIIKTIRWKVRSIAVNLTVQQSFVVFSYALFLLQPGSCLPNLFTYLYPTERAREQEWE